MLEFLFDEVFRVEHLILALLVDEQLLSWLDIQKFCDELELPHRVNESSHVQLVVQALEGFLKIFLSPVVLNKAIDLRETATAASQYLHPQHRYIGIAELSL